MATLLVILVSGLPHFDAARAFDFPPGAFDFNRGFVLGLGSAALIAIYDYLGYYDICYIGDEVRDPARVIPRSILYSILGCAVAYFLLHLTMLGVLPWREMLTSKFVVSEFMEHLHGRGAAVAVTLMILWTAFGSVFALLLGYSRIPYAAAVQGDFFARLREAPPEGQLPAGVALHARASCPSSPRSSRSTQVITALITTRILVQFMGQIFALPLLRKRLAGGEPAVPDVALSRARRDRLPGLGLRVPHLGMGVHRGGTGHPGRGSGGLPPAREGLRDLAVRTRRHAGLLKRSPMRGHALLVLGTLAVAASARAQAPDRLLLREGWGLQSSAKAGQGGEAVSQPGFDASAWSAITVPNTVVGALVEDGTYPDPFFGMNLRTLPGMTYPVGEELLAPAHVAREPVRARVVVPHGVRSARGPRRARGLRCTSTASTTARTSG